MPENKELDHIATIKRLLLTVQASTRMHALIVEGPAGWGKTTAVDEAMGIAGVAGVHVGAYSTPLHLFNFLYQNGDRFVVIDDCAGLFCDPSAMAILKAATWPQGKGRTIRWGSTSSKAMVDEFVFMGKLIIICNSFPTTADADAVRSRSFPCRIDVNVERAKELLQRAASDAKWYPDASTARAVTDFLCQRVTSDSLSQISYRTLQMGYELAQHNADHWENLLEPMIANSMPENPKKIIRSLAKKNLRVKDQLRMFEKSTGLKRRTFFKYRRELNLTKD